jgi:hypothetical protein
VDDGVFIFKRSSVADWDVRRGKSYDSKAMQYTTICLMADVEGFDEMEMDVYRSEVKWDGIRYSHSCIVQPPSGVT